MRNTTIYTKELLLSLYEKGLAMREIAEVLGCAVGKIHRLMTEYGIRPKTQAEYAAVGKFDISECQKRRLSKMRRGGKATEETRKKMSAAKKGVYIRPSAYGGHTKKHQSGYILVYSPDHPYATKEGYVFEHILAYEKYHSCLVDRGKFVIHHINGDKQDNSKENLQLMTKSEHMSLHLKLRKSKNKEIKYESSNSYR